MQALASRSYREIAEELLRERRQLGFPPYARVVMFRADAPELEQALLRLDAIRELLSQTPGFDAIQCIGPMPSLMTRRVGRYRAQLCLLARDYRALRAVLAGTMPALEQMPGGSRVGWNIDVDAQDL